MSEPPRNSKLFSEPALRRDETRGTAEPALRRDSSRESERSGTRELGSGTSLGRSKRESGARTLDRTGAICGRWTLEERASATLVAETYVAVGRRKARALVEVVRAPFTLDPSIAAAFRRESWSTARVRHPALPEILDDGVTDDGAPWVARAFPAGTSLTSEFARRPITSARLDDAEARLTASVARVMDLAIPLGDALVHAHRLGVFHGDLRPETLFRDPLSILGFVGDELLARIPPAQRPASHHLYAAPELGTGVRCDARADQFAFAAVLSALLAGAPPRRRNVQADGTLEPFPRDFVRDANSGSGAPSPRMIAVLQRALAPAPEDRFPDVASFVAALVRADLNSGNPASYGPEPIRDDSAQSSPLQDVPEPKRSEPSEFSGVREVSPLAAPIRPRVGVPTQLLPDPEFRRDADAPKKSSDPAFRRDEANKFRGTEEPPRGHHAPGLTFPPMPSFPPDLNFSQRETEPDPDPDSTPRPELRRSVAPPLDPVARAAVPSLLPAGTVRPVVPLPPVPSLLPARPSLPRMQFALDDDELELPQAPEVTVVAPAAPKARPSVHDDDLEAARAAGEAEDEEARGKNGPDSDAARASRYSLQQLPLTPVHAPAPRLPWIIAAIAILVAILAIVAGRR